jgi:hypothetical protein
MTETSAPARTVTVQRSDDIAREMTYVRADGDRHVVSVFRHGRVRFYNVPRSEIQDSDDAVFLAAFFAAGSI